MKARNEESVNNNGFGDDDDDEESGKWKVEIENGFQIEIERWVRRGWLVAGWSGY